MTLTDDIRVLYYVPPVQYARWLMQERRLLFFVSFFFFSPAVNEMVLQRASEMQLRHGPMQARIPLLAA